MMQPARALTIPSEVFRNQWLRWKDELGNYREICELAHYFAFRQGGELSVDTISKFLKAPSIPVRPQGFINLYTMLGAAHWRGLVTDRQMFVACLEQWGLQSAPEAGHDWERIWGEITDGIRAYEAALRDPRIARTATGTPADAARPRMRRVAISLLALLLLAMAGGLAAWQADQAATASLAQRLQNQLNSTYVAVLGGLPNPAQTSAPAEVFATVTAVAAAETAVSLVAAHPTALALPVADARMMYVPAGCFWVGNYASIRSSPIFYRCLPAFWMDEFRVSNEQYQQVMHQQPRSRSCADYGWEACATLPVENVTWWEARDFCAARGAETRLPTELEWEYAARGPLSNIFPWGNQFDAARLDVHGQTLTSTAPSAVDSYLGGRSWAGVVGMVGGVSEWTGSLWGGYPYAADETRADPADTRRARVVRGASFVADSTDNSRLAAYNRGAVTPGTRTYLTGFRCVRAA